MPETGKQESNEPIIARGDASALRKFADSRTGKALDGKPAFVIPDSAEAYSEAIDNGAIEALHNAGFTICAPGTPNPV